MEVVSIGVLVMMNGRSERVLLMVSNAGVLVVI